jgi:hypothetical protein
LKINTAIGWSKKAGAGKNQHPPLAAQAFITNAHNAKKIGECDGGNQGNPYCQKLELLILFF